MRRLRAHAASRSRPPSSSPTLSWAPLAASRRWGACAAAWLLALPRSALCGHTVVRVAPGVQSVCAFLERHPPITPTQNHPSLIPTTAPPPPPHPTPHPTPLCILSVLLCSSSRWSAPGQICLTFRQRRWWRAASPAWASSLLAWRRRTAAARQRCAGWRGGALGGGPGGRAGGQGSSGFVACRQCGHGDGPAGLAASRGDASACKPAGIMPVLASWQQPASRVCPCTCSPAVQPGLLPVPSQLFQGSLLLGGIAKLGLGSGEPFLCGMIIVPVLSVLLLRQLGRPQGQPAARR